MQWLAQKKNSAAKAGERHTASSAGWFPEQNACFRPTCENDLVIFNISFLGHIT